MIQSDVSQVTLLTAFSTILFQVVGISGQIRKDSSRIYTIKFGIPGSTPGGLFKVSVYAAHSILVGAHVVILAALFVTLFQNSADKLAGDILGLTVQELQRLLAGLSVLLLFLVYTKGLSRLLYFAISLFSNDELGKVNTRRFLGSSEDCVVFGIDINAAHHLAIQVDGDVREDDARDLYPEIDSKSKPAKTNANFIGAFIEIVRGQRVLGNATGVWVVLRSLQPEWFLPEHLRTCSSEVCELYDSITRSPDMEFDKVSEDLLIRLIEEIAGRKGTVAPTWSRWFWIKQIRSNGEWLEEHFASLYRRVGLDRMTAWSAASLAAKRCKRQECVDGKMIAPTPPSIGVTRLLLQERVIRVDNDTEQLDFDQDLARVTGEATRFMARALRSSDPSDDVIDAIDTGLWSRARMKAVIPTTGFVRIWQIDRKFRWLRAKNFESKPQVSVSPFPGN